MQPIVWIVFFFIVVVVITVFIHSLKTNSHPGFQQATPGLLATAGILGTFAGILLGLSAFDVHDIDASIPQLLEGLKAAFGTSIVGLLLAFAAKCLRLWALRDTRQIVPADIHQVLQQQRDALYRLTEEFPRFAERVSATGSERLVEALDQVVRNFNHNLTGQFGENFAGFNNAVGQLLAWQQEHKKDLNTLRRQFKQTLTGLSASKAALAEITEHTKTIPEQLRKLDSVVSQLDEQQSALEARLEAFPLISDRVEEAMFRIEQKVDGTAHRIHSSIERSSNRYEKLAQEAANLIEGFDSVLQKVREKFENAAETAFNQQQFHMHELFDGLDKATREAWDRHHRSLSKELKDLDGIMHEKIECAMQEMANLLTAITGKFVEDYCELIERMKSVVTRHEFEKDAEPADEEFV